MEVRRDLTHPLTSISVFKGNSIFDIALIELLFTLFWKQSGTTIIVDFGYMRIPTLFILKT